MVSNAHSATDDKIHLSHLFFFIIQYVLSFLFGEVAGQQAKCYIVEELGANVLLWVEEDSKVVKDIIEQIVYYDSSLDASWQHLHKFISLLNLF